MSYRPSGMLFPLILAVALGAFPAVSRGDDPPTAEQAKFFETHVRPVLAQSCVKCHGEKKQEGSLRLDSLEAMLKGGDSGPAIVPGKPAESILVEAIKYESYEMPPTGQLSESKIETLVKWVAMGAPWPETDAHIREAAMAISDEDREWWAFQPLTAPNVPELPNDNWSRNPIDRFVLQKLAAQKMTPAPEADRLTLVRRLYFDLTGLPPTPEQIDEFLNDSTPDAWERLVDQLLESKHYGEHWARHWLDLVRYAESDGWNQDAYRPHIWRYRDYVVKSLNADKPYPRFVMEQLAGDEVAPYDPEALAATGFLRLGIYEYNQRDARSHWDDIMNEMVDTTGDVFLGMGMACARCHDHKFDPVLQRDYFKLRAFFEPIIWRDDVKYATPEELRDYAEQLAVWKEQSREIQTQIDDLLRPYYDRKWASTADKFPLDIQACFFKPVEERTSWEHQMAYLIERQFEEEAGGPLKSMKKEDQEKYEELKKQLAAFDEAKPQSLPELMTVTDFPGRISPTVIPDDPRHASVAPGFLTVLTSAAPEIPTMSHSSGRRTALAEWIGRPDNPLTTRVIVNRIWQHHFGQGIVPTSSDFGHLGQPPTHPELLDWLTVNFVENGWSIKQLHRLILNSAAWRQSAHHPQADAYQELDPAEELLWRARIRRLASEQIRDAMLVATGELDATVGGPSGTLEQPRRSLYIKSFRNTPDEFMHLFDAANGLKSVSERNSTTTPLQALMLINGDYPLGRAKKLAERVLQERPEQAGQLIDRAMRLTWNRPPTDAETQAALEFLGASAEQPGAELDRDRLVDFCHVLLNSNEFLYVD